MSHTQTTLKTRLSAWFELARRAERMAPGPWRIRALMSSAHAARGLDRVSMQRGLDDPTTSWHSCVLSVLEQALAPYLENHPEPWQGAQTLLTLARNAPHQGIHFERARLLIDGLALGGALRHLHRIAVEVATAPAQAADLAARLPTSHMQAAAAPCARMVQTGCLGVGRDTLFIANGPAEDVAQAFEPSLHLLAHLARRGEMALAEGVATRLARAERKRALSWLIAARHIAGDESGARGDLRRAAKAQHDRALTALVVHEIGAGRFQRAEALAERIHNAAAKGRARAWLLRGELRSGLVRRELLSRSRFDSLLDEALTRAEMFFASAHYDEAEDQMSIVEDLLQQCAPASRRSLVIGTAWSELVEPWQRAFRLCVGLASRNPARGVAISFPRRTVAALMTQPALQEELKADLAINAARFNALQHGLGDELPGFEPYLDALYIEAWAPRLDPGAALQALSEADLGTLRAPNNADAAFLAGALVPPQALERVPKDALSVERAAYDLGFVSSPRGSRRRKALLNAVRATLKRAGATPEAAIRLRLRLLGRLGVESADELRQVLLPDRGVSVDNRLVALGILAGLHPRKARQALLEDVLRVGLTPAQSCAAFTALVEKNQLRDAHVGAWQRLLWQLRKANAGDPMAWWQDFIHAWRERAAGHFDAELLPLLANSLAARHTGCTGEVFVEELWARVERLKQHGVEQMFTAAAEKDVTEWALALLGPAPAWSVGKWRKIVAEAQASAGSVDTRLVQQYAARLTQNGDLLAQRLLAGRAPTSTLEAPITLGATGLTLKYLEKRADFLSYMRIADSVPCCFASDGSHYVSGMRNLRWIYRLWQDPMSFGMHICRRGEPIGFVFGGFGFEMEPRLLINGVYLKRQVKEQRVACLDAVREHLAAPLGISTIGVASQYGGSGAMPSGYVYSEAQVTRFRALRSRSGSLEHEVYDDISNRVNEPCSMSMYWSRAS